MWNLCMQRNSRSFPNLLRALFPQTNHLFVSPVVPTTVSTDDALPYRSYRLAAVHQENKAIFRDPTCISTSDVEFIWKRNLRIFPNLLRALFPQLNISTSTFSPDMSTAFSTLITLPQICPLSKKSFQASSSMLEAFLHGNCVIFAILSPHPQSTSDLPWPQHDTAEQISTTVYHSKV